MGMLAGKVAVITGGTSGIGAATARLFAAEGATVITAGRRKDEGERLAAELSLLAAEGATAEFVRADVCAEADVEALIGHVADRFGRLDCLVNNAGGDGKPGGIAAVELASFWETLAADLGGVALGMKHAAPVMVEQGSGSIINVAGIGGRLGGWPALDRAAARAAVIQLTRWAAAELGEHGVRVNAVSPGAAADVAPALAWLASDGAAFVTGQDLAVDGGITAGRPG